MLGFDLLIPGTLLTLAATVPPESKNLCPHVKAVEINIVPATDPVQYDFSRTMKEMQAQKMDTINPYGFQGMTMTQGYMQGRIVMKPKTKLGNKVNQSNGDVCIWYDKINVPIKITPTIFIAQEVYKDACARSVVLEHEMKHVMADRKMVNQFAKSLGQKIYAALAERGFRAEPVPYPYAQDMANRMYDVVNQIIQHEYKRFDLDRMEVQRGIDNIQEYERMNALCPDFQKNISSILNAKSKR